MRKKKSCVAKKIEKGATQLQVNAPAPFLPPTFLKSELIRRSIWKIWLDNPAGSTG